MFNFSFNLLSLLGFLDVLLGIGIPIIGILMLLSRSNNPSSQVWTTLYALQIAISFLTLPIVGLIFIFYSWKYDPLMQFGCFLLHVLVIYLVVKDILISLIHQGKIDL